MLKYFCVWFIFVCLSFRSYTRYKNCAINKTMHQWREKPEFFPFWKKTVKNSFFSQICNQVRKFVLWNRNTPRKSELRPIQNGRSRTVEHFEDHFFWKMLCKSQSPYLNIIKVEPQWSPELWKIIDMTWHDNRNGELKSSSLAIRVSAYQSCGCFIYKAGWKREMHFGS
jgi:hypothetical protein